MKKLLYTLTALVVVVSIAGLAAVVMISSKNAELSDQVNGLETQVQVLEGKLSQSEEELAEITGDLALSQDSLELASVELDEIQVENEQLASELADTTDELADTQSQLSSKTYEVSRKTTEIASLEAELESLQDEMTLLQETLDGLGMTVLTSQYNYDVVLTDNPDAEDPTWDELKAFLDEQNTHRNYVLNLYDCSQYSQDLHDAAEEAGIRAATVHIGLEDTEYGHALNAFLTTDYGLIYVDRTNGDYFKAARIRLAKEYRSLEISKLDITHVQDDWYWNGLSSYYYLKTDLNTHAKVEYIRLYW